jgi:two-component system chemotaxis response regulator CheB
MTGTTNASPVPEVVEPVQEASGRHDIVVIGASAGGVEALRRFISELDPMFDGSIFVVLHLPTNAHSALPDILNRAGPLPVAHAIDGQHPQPGHIYVAPPDVHLLLRRHRIQLVRGPTENGHRPAIDPLFRSAAESYGSRAIGVVLSGVLDDGAHGLLAIARRGGLTAVQSPSDALYASMPQSAIDTVPVDVVASAGELGASMMRLLGHARVPGEDPRDPPLEVEAALEPDALEMPGRPSRFTCPDCGGSLWDAGDDEPGKFRCRVGHSWTTLGLLERQAETLEAALWTALRALSERADLARRMRDDASERHHRFGRDLFQRQLDEYEAKAEVLRHVLATPEPLAVLSEEQFAGTFRADSLAGDDTPEDVAESP